MLVIDESEDFRSALEELLGENGFRVAAASVEEAAPLLLEFRPDAIVCDGGADNLRDLLTRDTTIAVVVLARDVTNARGLTDAGAFDVIKRELDPLTITLCVTRAVNHARIQKERARLMQAVDVANRTIETRNAALTEQQRAFEEESAELERRNRRKSEFLANMSHELRTPLNSIIGFTDLVLTKTAATLEPKQAKNLEKVLSNARHLLDLINDILDISKIEAGHLELAQEEIDLAAVLENAAAMADVLVANKPVKLVRAIETPLPAMRGDRTKIGQVLLNLLSNACKFTEEGTVTLAARGEGDVVVISVADTGAGIAEADLPVLFDEFRQVGDASRRQEGTGLGLAIVKKLVEAFGGSIRVESVLTKGSTFHVELPLAGPPDQAGS